MWKEISWEYMSEETEVEDDSDAIVKHSIPFRSDRKNRSRQYSYQLNLCINVLFRSKQANKKV